MAELRRPALSDLARFAVPSDPTISPDGTRVVYVLRTVDADADENVDRLWLATTSGEAPRELTTGRADSGPRFSPDGTSVAFLRAQDGPQQLWRLRLDGGEPERLTELPLGAGTPVWSPDGKRIAFSAPVDLAATSGETEQARDARAAAPLTQDRLFHKLDGAGRLREVRQHVFVLDLGDRSVKQVTSGDFHASTPAWSPDGGKLVYGSGLAADADLSGESSAYVLRLSDDEAEPRRIGPPGGTVSAVNWAGADILLVCAPDTEVRNARLARVDPDTGDLEYLTTGLDRNVMPGAGGYPGALPQPWAEDILFCARDRGCTQLYTTGAAGTRKLIDGNRVVSGLSVAGSAGVAAVVVSTVDSAGEISLLDPASGELTPLTSHTAEAFGDVELFTPVERTFAVSDGGEVHGWLVRDPAAIGPLPLLVDVHGGPHNAWSPVRDPAHLYHQVLAARGWAVLLLNPRASDGYGEDFLRGAVGAWGEADERDFLEPVDQLVADGTADPKRLALCGYSYGGYMACWLPTRTGRFAAVVAGGVVSDLVSMAGTSDAGSMLFRSEIGGTFWDDPARFAALSPIAQVGKVTSPTLVLHGEADERCPVGQAEQWFGALRARDVPAELVLYPGASHLFILNGRPSHRADYNRRVVDWVVRHTRTAARDGAVSAAVPLDQAYWQRRLDLLAEEHGIVGASLAIHFGEETAEAAYGVVNKRTEVPATPDSIFQIGSISKVYTATVAMRLVDEGKLSLDAPVVDVLPDLVLTDPEVTKRVTLRHLLTHTSGIDGDVFTDTGRGDDCVERYVAGLAEVAQNHPIDATWSYCNSGFVLAGRMIERVTGLVWDEAMRELLFRPLGLTATVTLPEEALLHNAALGHVNGKDGVPVPAPRWEIPRSSGPAGTISASAREVLEFARMHLRGGLAADGTRVLSEALTADMRRNQVTLPEGVGLADSWGLGWFRHHWQGHEIVGHDGGTIGQIACLRILPERDLAVCLLTNGGPARDLYNALYREIFRDLVDVEMSPPFGKPDVPASVDAASVTGVYERAGVRLDVFEEDAAVRMRVTQTGAMAELGAAEPMVLDLLPDSENRYLARMPGERQWTPVLFYRLADGTPYVHFGGRAAPKL
ncbi:serine hydrolase [Amycolatopsis sp. NPDC058986]|uniref:serine hydrolase n=1 Tax=unclassified Amycolatopsis TaxID=2618356 RepID=UPI003671B2AF